MKIHSSPFEQVTAITDAIMGGLSLYVAMQVMSFEGYKAGVWGWVFALLALSSFIGAVSHGFAMTQQTNDRVWMPLNFSLGIVLALFGVGTILDLSGEPAARAALPFLLVVGVAFFLITVWKPGSFLIFIGYEAVVMVFALGGYGFLFFKGTLPGAGWMVAGIFMTMVAAVVQATGKAGKGIFWYFDNNGMFHLIQMIGVLLLLAGIKTSM